jgi:hypothetical protein
MADSSKAERRADRTRHQVTTGVLARLLDIDQRTVHMWTQRGILPPTFVAASGRAYYDRHHVAAALAAAGHTVPQNLGAGRVALPDKIRSVYVAGPSREIGRCEQVMARIRASGVRITHDWAAAVRRIEGLGTAISDPEQEQEAISDLAGVASADALVVLAPQNGISGCWVEMGAALALCRPVILSLGECPVRMVFEALVHVRRDDAAACRSVERRADKSAPPTTGIRRPRQRGRTALIPTQVTVE